MAPNTMSVETVEPPVTASHSTAVELARLTGKVEQVIGDHERRITALEQRRDGGAQRGAAVWSPIISAAALAVVLAQNIRWN